MISHEMPWSIIVSENCFQCAFIGVSKNTKYTNPAYLHSYFCKQKMEAPHFEPMIHLEQCSNSINDCILYMVNLNRMETTKPVQT